MVLLHIAQMSHWISSTSTFLEIDSSHGVRTTHGLPTLLIFLPQTTSYGGTWRRGVLQQPTDHWSPEDQHLSGNSKNPSWDVRQCHHKLQCACCSCTPQKRSLDWTCYQLLNCVRNNRQSEKTLLSNFNWIFLLNICEKKFRINVHF